VARRLHSLILLACMALSACTGTDLAGPGSECGIDKGVPLPVTLRGPALLVPVRVNGIGLVFLIDTGTAVSVIERRAALALGLLHQKTTQTVRDVTGEREVDIVMAGNLGIGSFNYENQRLLVSDGLPFDGAIGLDVLSRYDLDIDEPHRRMDVHMIGLCEDQRPMSESRVLEMPAIRGITNGTGADKRTAPYLMVAARLDGKAGLAIFDTGALGGSFVSPRFAAAAGATAEQMAADITMPIRGLGRTTQVSLHRFDKVELGGEVFQRPALFVSSDSAVRFPLVLGADYFRTHRVWFNFTSDRVFSMPVTAQNVPGS
jgi:hypothetical protein